MLGRISSVSSQDHSRSLKFLTWTSGTTMPGFYIWLYAPHTGKCDALSFSSCHVIDVSTWRLLLSLQTRVSHPSISQPLKALSWSLFHSLCYNHGFRCANTWFFSIVVDMLAAVSTASFPQSPAQSSRPWWGLLVNRQAISLVLVLMYCWLRNIRTSIQDNEHYCLGLSS